MYTKRVYSAKDVVKWTRFDTFKFLIIGAIFVVLYDVLDLKWLNLPFRPLALLGTAVAFLIGFQNSAAYGRIWEARKIWGGIVNTSRTFGMYLQDMITNEHAKEKVSEEELRNEVKTFTYRHIAWMTALRFSMRQNKSWETVIHERSNQEWRKIASPPEFNTDLKEELSAYLSKEDIEYVMNKGNKQTAVLYLQSHHLRKLKEKGMIWEFSFLELENLVQEMFTLQGKSERIKNFPYPRQFASISHYFMWIFIFLLPLGLMPEFSKGISELTGNIWIKPYLIWLFVPSYALVAWVFHTMERIGRAGENPFEGLANDVPISTISRGIEIDLRQNLGEDMDTIPKQYEEVYGVQF